MNIAIAVFSLLVGGSILYFSSMDLEELKELGFLQKILGVLTKLSPLVIKLCHVLKFILMLVLAYFAFFLQASMFTKTGKYLTYTDADWYKAINLTEQCTNKTWANETLFNYNKTIKIFYGFDFFVMMICFFVLGLVKNIVEQPAFVYIPLSSDSSSVIKYCCHFFGP
jgi:hypothetical protein